MALFWLILKWYTILEDFFLLDNVRYHDDVMTILNSNWFNLKILMSGWYCNLTSSCVSFTIYQQYHGDRYNIRMPTGLTLCLWLRSDISSSRTYTICRFYSMSCGLVARSISKCICNQNISGLSPFAKLKGQLYLSRRRGESWMGCSCSYLSFKRGKVIRLWIENALSNS